MAHNPPSSPVHQPECRCDNHSEWCYRWQSAELDVNKDDRKVIAWDFEELNVRVYGEAAVSTMRAKFTKLLPG